MQLKLAHSIVGTLGTWYLLVWYLLVLLRFASRE